MGNPLCALNITPITMEDLFWTQTGTTSRRSATIRNLRTLSNNFKAWLILAHPDRSLEIRFDQLLEFFFVLRFYDLAYDIVLLQLKCPL